MTKKKKEQRSAENPQAVRYQVLRGKKEQKPRESVEEADEMTGVQAERAFVAIPEGPEIALRG